MFRRSSSGDTPASRVASGSTVRLVCIRFSRDRKSTRLNSSHDQISYAVFCLKKKNDGSALGAVRSYGFQGQRVATRGETESPLPPRLPRSPCEAGIARVPPPTWAESKDASG